jgi:uncharacterized protein YjbJ (UPF0337 family)
MSNLDDKVRGGANQAVGRVKQAAGDLTGDEKLKGEGEGQELAGKGQEALGKAKETVAEGLKKAADAVKGSGS